jgi:hypothetical protein
VIAQVEHAAKQKFETALKAAQQLRSTGALPVIYEVKQEAQRRGVELRILPTAQAIELLRVPRPYTNAILHVTC